MLKNAELKHRASRWLAPLSVMTLGLALLVGCGGGGGSSVDEAASEPVPREVGAAYVDPASGRLVLISKTGTRFVYFDVAQGTFTDPRPTTELVPGLGTALIGAAAFDEGAARLELSDLLGEARTLYDPAVDVEGVSETWASLGAAGSFSSVGAVFSHNSNLFVFNMGGSEYAAYDRDNSTWSPTFSFAGDFGGGGAPIANVGASVTVPADR